MHDLQELIFFMNKHWEPDFNFNYPLKRHIFSKLIGALEHPLMISINGPRRVGKTVVMKQIINYLIKQGFPRKNILFFSFDEYKEHPIKLIKEWEIMLGKKIHGKNYFMFLDEIQNIDKWAEKIKTLYDNLNIKIIVSGSASMALRKGNESLAGRILEFYLPPLLYNEYLLFSGKHKSEIKNIEWHNYLLYMKRQLPELAINEGLDAKEYIKTIVKKVIYEDTKKYFGFNETEKIEGIFKSIAKDPGQIINISDISKDFGISRTTCANYLFALEQSYLLRKLYNYSKNPRKSEIRLKKYYPFYTNLICYTDNTKFGKIAETEVAWKIDAEYFWNNRNKEIDFISEKWAIEVKMRKKIDYQDVKWVLKNEFKLKPMVVVSPETKIDVRQKLRIIRLNEIDKLAKFT